MKNIDPYRKFKSGKWNKQIDVRNFIHLNFKEYKGDDNFLEEKSAKTKEVLGKVEDLLLKEGEKGGVLGVDTTTASTIISHSPGYIDKDNEDIVGLQTDEPLVRGIKPHGGIRLVKSTLDKLGYKLDENIYKAFTEYVSTHNDSVFGVYKSWEDFHTPDGNMVRGEGLITGLPDNYSRGRIIGDYRRVALYGIDLLIQEKQKDLKKYCDYLDEEKLDIRVMLNSQIQALKDMKKLAESYGYNIGRAANNVKECIQWIYFAYLAAVKEQDGAAMSMGRIDAFIDIYAERDLEEGRYTEKDIQHFVDDFVLKLRIIRHLRHPEYDALFAGDPTWVTIAIGGMYRNGLSKSLITKTSYRFLHTLKNLGSAPEPNLTILWSKHLPNSFKKFAAKMSILSSSIQYESDELMRPYHGDDYGIACCVSAMTIGKQMQFFGARANLAKLLLMVINEGRNEHTGNQVSDKFKNIKNKKILDYNEIKKEFFNQMDWLANLYVQTMNLIHYMHDRHHYERSQMALHDTEVHSFMAFGMAGLSVVVDSLSAIKYAKVHPIYDKKTGLTKDFKITGDFPKFGNNDDRVDKIAVEVTKKFIEALRKYPTYRDAEHTLSILTITSNVVYGKHTGATPDGRKNETPFAPGANPMHGRDTKGAAASLSSVAKIPYQYCRDGISNTFTITPSTLGSTLEIRQNNLVRLLDGYFSKAGHHLNVNVLNRDTLLDAMEHPEKYPQLTIRVSGYAVHFVKLTKEQQKEVVERTFHERLSW